LETLGGHTGHIAIAVAFAAQADAVCVPEIEIDAVRLGKRLAAAVEERGYGLCVIGEGIGNVSHFCSVLADAAGHRIRLTSMGHAQRGGPPSFFDRRLARLWGELAVMQLLAGLSGYMLAWQAGTTGLVSLSDVFAAPPRAIDVERYNLINEE
jgi:6-phosphofructokinase 1